MGASRVVGIADGYRGLIEGRARELGSEELSGILTLGGTILGSSREKPFEDAGPEDRSDQDEAMDKPELIKENYKKLGLDCLVVLGGNGTQTTAALLQREGLEVIGLPKTIDNDIWGTEVSFGFHTAVDVATEAIDRLHSTAQSHNRVMVIELMGPQGRLARPLLGDSRRRRRDSPPRSGLRPRGHRGPPPPARHRGKSFSIVVVAEGALSVEEARMDKKERKKSRAAMAYPSIGLSRRGRDRRGHGHGDEGHRPGLPPARRSPLPLRPPPRHGVRRRCRRPYAAARVRQDGRHARREVASVPLDEVAGKTRRIPADNELLRTARRVGTCLGDE